MLLNIVAGIVGFFWASVSVLQIILLLRYALPLIKKFEKVGFFIEHGYLTCKKRYMSSLTLHVILSAIVLVIAFLFFNKSMIKWFFIVSAVYLIFAAIHPKGFRDAQTNNRDVIEFSAPFFTQEALHHFNLK